MMTKARSRTSTRRRNTVEPWLVVRTPAGLHRSHPTDRWERLVVAADGSHLEIGVALRDQPRPDAGRDFARGAHGETVEANAVELRFPRSYLDSDLHMPPMSSRIHTNTRLGRCC